jgi:hypothetical protein
MDQHKHILSQLEYIHTFCTSLVSVIEYMEHVAQYAGVKNAGEEYAAVCG